MEGVWSSRRNTTGLHQLCYPLSSPLLIDVADDYEFFPALLSSHGITLVKHLIDTNTGTWREADYFQSPLLALHRRSIRLLQLDLLHFHGKLLQNFSLIFNENGVRPASFKNNSACSAPQVNFHCHLILMDSTPHPNKYTASSMKE